MFETSNKKTSKRNCSLIPNLLALDVLEQVAVMRRQENTTYSCSDFFADRVKAEGAATAKGKRRRPRFIVDAECRRKMCEWNYQIIDYCNFRRETVDIAMSYLDRFLSSSNNKEKNSVVYKALHNKRHYQLAAMTSLYMAIKLWEPLEMGTDLLAQLSRGEYTPQEIAEMERTILKELQWMLNGPTRLTFATHFMALLPVEVRQSTPLVKELMEMVRFQTELATADYYFTTERLSTTALACVMNAMEASELSVAQTNEFVQGVVQFCNMNPVASTVQEARMRLMNAAVPNKKALQSRLESAGKDAKTPTHTDASVRRSAHDSESSPVCVSISTTMQQQRSDKRLDKHT